jgi:uncharacterized protein (DUF488 family)
MEDDLRKIWTIGHSTRPIDEFVALLRAHDIQLLVDIRTFPGSRRYPHFNKESLAITLQSNGIGYEHMIGLGGRRKPLKDSVNVGWRHPSFRGYADYMQTDEFRKQITQLEAAAAGRRTAFMCSEGPWWKCHRSLVSDFLKVRGWKVLHIMAKDRVTEHPFTSPARPVQGQLFYDEVSSARK